MNSLNTAGCWHKSGVVKDLLGKPPLSYDYNTGWGKDIVTVRIINGSYYNMDVWTGSNLARFGLKDNPVLLITIDVNGNKSPNVIGKDIYLMGWTQKGIVPAGDDLTDAQVKNNCLNGNGYYCLKYVINNSWIIDDRVWKK